MSEDIIQLDYGLAEDMARVFAQSREDVQDVMQEMQSIANTLEEGALLGRGGQAFVDAIRSKLCPSLARLADKMEELEGDVQAAIRAMQQADEQSRGMFGR